MRIVELALYHLARAFSQTEMAHSSNMRAAMADADALSVYRSANEIQRVIGAARQFGVSLDRKRVLDFGCNDGVLTGGFLRHGAAHVFGVDIDARAIERARAVHSHERITYAVGTAATIPLPDASVDAVVGNDVFEHVSEVPAILKEFERVLVPGGQVLIGTWGWCHPFAPHLWSAMPVPWVHLLVSDRTLMAACREVYSSDWYVPTMHDLDAAGRKSADKYHGRELSPDYLNRYLIRDFERAFRASGLAHETHLVPFGSPYASWTAPLLAVPWLREFLTGYVWFVLRNPR